MQMQAMNHYGNQRGFGGPPQPQRQAGRRGMNRGGFRGNSRFEHNQNQRNFNQNHQQNQHHGGQRPNNENPQGQQGDKAQSQQQAKPPQQKPVQQPAQPQPAQQSPQQKPAQPAQPAQQKQETPVQKPVQNVNKPQPAESKDKTDNVQVEKQTNKPPIQQRNANNIVGNNKQGGWSQGGPGNRQGGFGNKPFGGPKQGQHAGGPPAQGGQAGPGGPPRNQHPRNRGPQQDAGGKPVQREEQMLANKLKDLMGPILDLPPLEQTEMKFNGRSRLYIGNLAGEVAEEDVQKLFGSYGETAELFINKEKGFGFIKLDCRNNAEKAKRELDGRNMNGRTLRVRFAPHNSAVRVKNLPPFVSNELLYRAFEIFGKIERAYVKVDDRGKTVGEGVVEYARKPSALAAIRNCTEKCFFLTSSLRPVIVESYEEPDEFDGYPEKNLPKKHPEFMKAREVGPRFSEPASFEHEYGTRWKQLHELHRQKEEALKKELAVEEEKLEAQMEYAKYEHETELLRAQLRQREQDRERQKRSWEQAERAADERRDHERVQLQRQEDELATRMRHQDDELRRRQQENTLFVQAQRLNSMLDRQEQGMFDQQPMEGGFRDQFEMQRGYDDAPQNRGWDGPRGMDDFPNKRRRY